MYKAIFFSEKGEEVFQSNSNEKLFDILEKNFDVSEYSFYYMGYYLNNEKNLTYDEIPNPIFGKEKTIVILQMEEWTNFCFENKTIISKELKCPKCDESLEISKKSCTYFLSFNAKTIMI